LGQSIFIKIYRIFTHTKQLVVFRFQQLFFQLFFSSWLHRFRSYIGSVDKKVLIWCSNIPNLHLFLGWGQLLKRGAWGAWHVFLLCFIGGWTWDISRLGYLSNTLIFRCVLRQKKDFLFCFFGKSAMRGAFFLRRSKGGRKFLKNSSCFQKSFCFCLLCFQFSFDFSIFFSS